MNRFEALDEWQDAEKLMKFLRVFVDMASSTRSEHRITIQKLMVKAIESRMIDTIKRNYVLPMTSAAFAQHRLEFMQFIELQLGLDNDRIGTPSNNRNRDLSKLEKSESGRDFEIVN